jgi:aspartyl-tRNA(Asn)/glutamyl-tRNA(Gln) amidotransferase subunit A
MTRIDPVKATATELSIEIGNGSLSPVDVVDTLLARVEQCDAVLHSFVAVYGADARLAAEGADRAIRSGHRIGPLHGIPIAFKDLVEIAGRVTTGGSRAWAEHVSSVTATVVRRLIGAGMIILGKTHSTEFAMGAWGTNAHMGAPWNPWDLSTHRTSGGSSSGSGVAVGGGLVPVALGTDTGGSVRVPAAFCGIVGLRPMVGRVSTYGVLPLSTTLDTVGPMARSVEDVALLLRVLQGSDEQDPLTLGHPIIDPLQTLRRGVAGLLLGVLPDSERQAVDRDVLAAYDAAITKLEELGARIAVAPLPHRFEEFAAATGRIIGTEGYRFVGQLVDDPDLPLDPNVRPRLQIGRTVSSRDYLLTLAQRESHRRAYREAMSDFDGLLTPTTPLGAIPVAEVDELKSPSAFTRSGSYLGLCGLALPNGFTAAGMPTSLQILCQGREEAMALRIGWAYEQATEWHMRRPPKLNISSHGV